MLRATTAAILLSGLASASVVQDRGLLDPILGSGVFHTTCESIRTNISDQSSLYYPLDLLGKYQSDTTFWSAAVQQSAACSVEPGTPQDVGKILEILGRTNTSFGVKGGGHSPNKGFSSTSGIQISLARFNGVNYNSATNTGDSSVGTVDVGAGLTWDDVYSKLADKNVNVVGGRVSGVGVAGFTLGGGYSWKSNQYGLTIDNTVGFELVLPNNTVVQVTETSYPDLFFGLKGGWNNFGIVTKFTYKAYPQTQVWGGLVTYDASKKDAIIAATVDYQTKIDSKSSMILSFGFVAGAVPLINLLLFYDGPSQGTPAIFNGFLNIPSLSNTAKNQSYLSLVQSFPKIDGRQAFSAVPIPKYTTEVMNDIWDELTDCLTLLTLPTAATFNIEPFQQSMYDAAKPGAYPHGPSYAATPFNLDMTWSLPLSDDFFFGKIKEYTDSIYNSVLADGQDVDGGKKILYGNYALAETPVEEIWGENLSRLQGIRGIYDPGNIMRLTGGFKL